MKVFLHIGPPKTGTTSIQKSLNSFQDEKNIYANFDPLSQMFFSENGNHSKSLRYIFDDTFFNDFHKNNLGIDNITAKDLQRNLKNVLKEFLVKNNNKNIIFSAEGLALIDEETLKKIINFFKDLNFEPNLIFYYRDPIKRVKSVLQQEIKNTYFHPYDHFWTFKQKKVSETLSIFIKYFSKDQIIVRSFEKEDLKNGCVVEDICSLMNINLKEKNIARNVNKSMSEDAFKVLYVRMKEHLKNGYKPGRIFNRDKIHRNIMRIFDESPKLSPLSFKIFSDANKNEEINFLSEKTNFQTPASFNKDGNYVGSGKDRKYRKSRKDFEDFDNYFSDLSTLNYLPLENFLIENGVSKGDLNNKDLKEKILLIDSVIYN